MLLSLNLENLHACALHCILPLQFPNIYNIHSMEAFSKYRVCVSETCQFSRLGNRDLNSKQH